MYCLFILETSRQHPLLTNPPMTGLHFGHMTGSNQSDDLTTEYATFELIDADLILP